MYDVNELLAKENEVNDFYRVTYDMYESGNYTGVISRVDVAMEKYENDPVIPKFEFLKVLAIGKSLCYKLLPWINVDPDCINKIQ